MMSFQRIAHLLLFAFVPAIVTACGEGNLRGRWEKSSDGKTYLAVVDDNGGKCGPLLVDGKPWPYKIGEPGPIRSGRHTIECGTGLAFEIPEGVVFRFNYWGP